MSPILGEKGNDAWRSNSPQLQTGEGLRHDIQKKIDLHLVSLYKEALTRDSQETNQDTNLSGSIKSSSKLDCVPSTK